MITTMKDREVIKMAVNPEAKSAIDVICNRYAMSKIEMVSRVFHWFSTQDEVIQAAVLGVLPAGLAEAAVEKKVADAAMNWDRQRLAIAAHKPIEQPAKGEPPPQPPGYKPPGKPRGGHS